MYLGRIVETAAADELFRLRAILIPALLSAIPVPRPRASRIARSCKATSRARSNRRPVAICIHDAPMLSIVAESSDHGSSSNQDGHATACHRWAELPANDGLRRRGGKTASRLDPLIAAFTPMKDVRASGGVDTVVGAGQVGRPA